MKNRNLDHKDDWGTPNDFYEKLKIEKSGKLSEKEKNTVTTMKEALKAKPKFMRLTFKEDGTFVTEPYSPEIGNQARWEYKNDILYIKTDKGVDKHKARLIDGKLEFKPIRSKVAIPVMILEKE
jgi:hypothetical protein